MEGKVRGREGRKGWRGRSEGGRVGRDGGEGQREGGRRERR